MQAAGHTKCVLTARNKTAYVWGDGGLDLHTVQCYAASMHPQSHRVTTTPGFFGPSPATHLRASSPFSHMQAELPALLSFPGGSNHKAEFDERCLHRVTADVHRPKSVGAHSSKVKIKDSPSPKSSPTPRARCSSPTLTTTQDIATRLLLGTTDQIKPVVAANLFSCPCRHLDSHLTVNPAVSRGVIRSRGSELSERRRAPKPSQQLF